MSPIVAKWWTNMIRKSWKQENHGWRLFGCHTNAKVWNRATQPSHWGHRIPAQALTPHRSQLITIPPSPQKLPERSLSFGAAEVRALPAQGSAHSLWHTHRYLQTPQIWFRGQDELYFWPILFFSDTLVIPSSPGTHLSAVTAVSNQTLPGQSRHRTPGNSAGRMKKCLQCTTFRASQHLHFSPWLPVPHPAAGGNAIHLLKVKINNYRVPEIVHHSLSAAPLYSTVPHLLIFQHRKKPG